MKVISPVTNQTVREFPALTADAASRIIDDAHTAFAGWKAFSFEERAVYFRQIAALLKSKKETYARLMAEEMGKPLREGRSEAEKCAWVCDYYADNADRFLSPEIVRTDATDSRVVFQPLGVILAVMPWNFPFWQVFRFAAPSIMAGNTAVLKHASNVPGCAMAIEALFKEAGFPENVFRTVLVGSDGVPELIAHPFVKAVTLTGSTPAGRHVASLAGQALKKTVLELGGSDPYIILRDADLDYAAEQCVTSRLLNSGQSCIAAKRFIVEKAVSEAFETRFVKRMAEKRFGSPFDEANDIGPLARIDLRDGLHDQVQRSIRAGAVCKLGGVIPDMEGAYYPPTVLTQVKPGMPAYEEELFGPVAAIITAEDEEDAIRIANDSVFGLGGGIFTRDTERGRRIVEERLEAGFCAVNAFVRSDPRLPFGGVKESGYGRELSHYGIKEFTNIKTVYVK